MNIAWKPMGLTVYVALVGVLMSYAIGFATQAELLIPLAAPIGIVLVTAMAWIPGEAQVVGWGVLTVWLLSTVYLGHGDGEYVALVVIVVLALLGVFKSPWFLVAAWALHPVWDVAIHRELDPRLTDLPIGCLIYDLVVAAYLAWRTWRGDLRTAGGEKSTAWPTAVKRVGLSLWVGLVVLVQVGLVWWADESGWLPWTTIGIALIVVAGMAWLRPIPQSLGWVVLTGWMAMTFAHGGQLVEILVFVALLAIAVLGYTSSPWWLVAAWGFHAAWSLLPRDIHHHGGAMGHLGAWPLASALFDVVITAYLVFAVLRGRLHRPVFTPRVPVAAD